MTRRGLVLFGPMSVIWGIPCLFIRVAVAEITPATLVLARTTIAAAIPVPVAATTRPSRAGAGPSAVPVEAVIHRARESAGAT